MKFQLKPILLLLSIAIILCSLISYFSKQPDIDYTEKKGYAWEEYDPDYFLRLQSIQSIIEYANQQFPSNARNSIAYYESIAKIVRKRFYHGYSHYSFADNPYAFLAGKLFWSHLSAIVIPDDIMKHPMAACSQQSIVLMEIFKRLNTDFRNVSLAGHYAVEAKIGGKWLYFDTNMEPDFKHNRESFANLEAHKRIASIYENLHLDSINLRKSFQLLQYGKMNAAPAPQATFFHKFCFFLHSKFTVALLLMIVLYSLRHNFQLKRRGVERLSTATAQ